MSLLQLQRWKITCWKLRFIVSRDTLLCQYGDWNTLLQEIDEAQCQRWYYVQEGDDAQDWIQIKK